MPAPKKPPTPVDGARLDGFINAVAGIGTSIDRAAQATVVATRGAWQDFATLETLYYEDDVCARIVDAIVDDSLRQGVEPSREVSVDDGAEEVDQEESQREENAIERRLREVDAIGKVALGAKFGRLFGGAGVIMWTADGSDLTKPLKLGSPLISLSVVDRSELVPAEYYDDTADPKYGEVKLWRVTQTGNGRNGASLVEVHESRILRFDGLPVSRRERLRQNGWSLSVLTRVFEIVRDASQNWKSVSNLVLQSTQAVFKLDGLASMIANGQDQVLQERMAAANAGRSILRAVIIDKDGEDFSYQTASLSGLDVILDKTWQRLAAAADMPATRLMGISPAGLNATGESDVRGWYDRCRTYQSAVLGPQLSRLVQVIAAEQGLASPEEWCAEFPSLWQRSPDEEADFRQKVANVDKAYIDAGVVTPEEVAIARFGSGGYDADGTVTIDVEARQTPPEPPVPPQIPPPPPVPGEPMPPEQPEEPPAEVPAEGE